MARFIPTVTINFRGKEAREFEHDTLAGRYVRGVEVILLAIGLALIASGILFLNGINPLHAGGSGWAPIAVAGLYCGPIVGKIGLRAMTRRLIPQTDLERRLNMDYHAVNTAIQEHNLQPRLIVNGTRYFAPTDFGEISVLLRAAGAPQSEVETLLRAAGDESQPARQHLLHPVIDTPALQQQVTGVTVAPEQPQSLQRNT